MKLFELKNDVVIYSPQALLLKPFKVLWDRDNSKGKAKAKDELAYVWYMEDARSDFYDIMDEDERRTEVLKFLTELLPSYKPDAAVKEAVKEYKRLSEGLSVKILRDTMYMVNNLRTAMVEMDFTERDNSNKPVHDPSKAVILAGKIPELLKNLRSIYREIEKEAEEQNAMRGSRLKAFFEEGM